MSVSVRLMSTSGSFRVESELVFASLERAIRHVTEHYSHLGFSRFQVRDEGDGDGGRITATTPGGRHGRNVAFFDWLPSDADRSAP